MADDDDARANLGPDELFAPSGPRRSSYTPPSNDADSLEAAANVFDDDDIAAAMAAELAKVASGPIPIVRPGTPEPDDFEPQGDAFAAEAPAPAPAAVVEPEAEPAPEPEPERAPEPEPQATAAGDGAPPPYIGAPAPTVPPAYAPPPPGYESASSYFPPAPEQFSAPAPAPVAESAPPAAESSPPAAEATIPPAPIPPAPQRTESNDEEIFRALHEDGLTPAATLDLISQLQAQLQLREHEAKEFSAWEEAVLEVGTPDAIAAVEQARAEFSGKPAAFVPAVEPDVASPTPFEPPVAAAEVVEPAPVSSAPSPSAFAPESPSTPEPGYTPPPAPEPQPEPEPDESWLARWAPSSDSTPEADFAVVAPAEESSFGLPPAWEPDDTASGEPSDDGTFVLPVITDPPVMDAAPEPAAPSVWTEEPVFRFAPAAPSVPSAPAEEVAAPTEVTELTEVTESPEIDDAPRFEGFAEPDYATPDDSTTAFAGPFPVDAPAGESPAVQEPEPQQPEPQQPEPQQPEAEQPVAPAPDGEPSLEGTAFADLLAAAPPPDPEPAPEPQIGTGSVPTAFGEFGSTPDTSFTNFDEPVGAPAPPPFDSIFDTPSAGGDPAPDPFAAPPFLAPPTYSDPTDQQSPFIDPLTFNEPPAFAPQFDAPPPDAFQVPSADLPAPPTANDAPAPPPPPPYSPPALVEPPSPGEVPPDFSSQVGVVTDFGLPTASPIEDAPAPPPPPAPFAEPTPVGEAAQPAPFMPPPPAPDAPPPPPANFEALLSGDTVDEGSPPPPEGQVPATPTEPTLDAATGAPIPFGEGVARDDAVDPSDSIFGSSLGTVAVSTTGVAVIAETVAVEPPVFASPHQPDEVVADAPVGAATVPVVAAAPRAFKAEPSGEEPTPLDQRVGRAARLFWLWFASNSSIVAVAFGGLVFALGMSLRQAIVATLIGIALSFLPLGLGTLAGKRSGQPTMVISRATFGVVGNIVPAVIGLLSRLFWGAALLWLLGAGAASILTGAKATDGFSEQQLTFIMMVFGFILAIIVAYFGYALIAKVQLVISIISAIFLVGFIALTAQHIDIPTALTTGDGSWVLAVTGAVLVFSFVGLVWANSGSDLARYQRPGSSGASSMLWATFGTALPTFILIAYGALLSASNPKVAAGLVSNPLNTLGTLLPGWYPGPLLLATALSLLSGAVVAIYSAGFGLQSVGVRLRRPASAIVAGILVLVVALVLTISVTNFTELFRDFATTIAVPVAAWAGLFASEIMIRNRRFDSGSLLRRGGVYADTRWANLSALVIISAIGLGLTSATVTWLGWEGYLFSGFGVSLSSDLAQTDLGVVAALILGLIFPIVAGVPAIRRQESATRTAE